MFGYRGTQFASITEHFADSITEQTASIIEHCVRLLRQFEFASINEQNVWLSRPFFRLSKRSVIKTDIWGYQNGHFGVSKTKHS